MPNWCHNGITVKSKNSNPKEEILSFVRRYCLFDSDKDCIKIDFTKVLDNPKNGPFSIGDECAENSLYFHFFTAWSPPVEVVEKLIEDNPHLSFSLWYSEPDMGFYGTFEGENGVITKDEYQEREEFQVEE
jgi:hypothetical protein